MIKNLQYILIIYPRTATSPLPSPVIPGTISKRTKNLVQINQLFFGELPGFFHLTTSMRGACHRLETIKSASQWYFRHDNFLAIISLSTVQKTIRND